MSFPAYPGYKDSGMAWLGSIPEHWLLYRSKNVFSERNIKALESDEQLTASQKYGVIPQKLFSELEDQKVMQVILGRDILKKAEVNDFVISMRSFQGGLEFSSYSGAVSSAYVPLYANRQLDNRFFKHLFKSVSFISALQNTSNLVRDGQALRYNNFVQLSLPFPSINEQRKIGAFLDHETTRIDALIEEQQRLIELLNEKRQAVISQAVSKGLDPTMPMKDSGVKWLGEVPAHWEVTPLRYVSTMIDGDRSSAYPSEGDLVDEGIPFVSSKNIVGYRFTDKNLSYITLEKFNSLNRGKLTDGDLVITVRGTIGHVAVFDSAVIGSNTGFINAQMMIIRPHAGLTEYIRLCSESYFWQKQLDVAAYGSTVKQLSNPIVGGLIIALPPRAEIPDLVYKIKVLECEFETLISKALKGTRLLQERRSALISAAVTGKIDVRGWQPPASVQPPESVLEAV